jgi:hypothetical protein
MKKAMCFAALIAVAVGFSGCLGSAPVWAPKTPIYAKWKAPLTTNGDIKDFGSKVGKATNKTYVGLVSVGDISIKRAARNGGIKTVKHVDYSYENCGLFLYQETTIIVYGD